MKSINGITMSLLLTLFCSVNVFAQSKADELREEGNLDGAIVEYKKILNKEPDNRANTYNLACAFALTYQIDSAYKYLDMALENDNTLWALCDPDLMALSQDDRWDVIDTQQLKKFQDEKGALTNPQYARQLLSLIQKDQAIDYPIDQAKKFYMKNGYPPQWYYPLGELKRRIGTDNYDELLSLIDQYGWPKYSTVGQLAADAPLLVINHNESEEVRIKFLPQIKEACLNGEGSCLEFAKINDRILVNTGQEQTYGMQFRYNEKRELEPFPIKDPEYVDQRRAAIGLEPLKDYLKKKINYNWTVAQKSK